MPRSFAQPTLPTPLLVPEMSARMAKADVRKAEPPYAELGWCLGEVQRVFGLTLEQFAFELGKDERQVARQIKGTERPQVEAVFAVDRFRPALLIAMAQASGHGVEIDTVIHIRRNA